MNKNFLAVYCQNFGDFAILNNEQWEYNFWYFLIHLIFSWNDFKNF